MTTWCTPRILTLDNHRNDHYIERVSPLFGAIVMKIGKTLYYVGSEPDGNATIETWIIRTIRGGKITAIWKLSCTWGKRSKKAGDFGWLDPIPAWCRRTWRANEPIPSWFGLHTTKRQAIADALKTTEPGDFDTQAEYDRHITSLKRMRI